MTHENDTESALYSLLRTMNMEKYHDLLTQHAIDLDILPELSSADLKEIGIPLGDRMRLLRAAAGLTSNQISDSRKFQSERRQLTVMFCDLVGSTELSTLIDAEDLRDLLRSYQDACFDATARHEGTVSRAYGDGLLIYFGFPLAHDEAPSHAILAAFDIIDAMQRLPRPEGLAEGRTLQVRIGIHTGTVVVGELRAGDWMDPMAVTGDTPNIAARLQAYAPPDGVVVSDATRQLTAKRFEFESLGEQTVKGVPRPLALFSPRPSSSHFAVRLHNEGLPDTPFVGREAERASLRSILGGVMPGGVSAIMLVAPPGLGKSRLTLDARQAIREADMRSLELHGSNLYSQTPFNPVIEFIERELGMDRRASSSTRLETLEALIDQAGLDRLRVVPLLAPLLFIDYAPAYPPLEMPEDRRMAATIEVMTACIRAIGGSPPLALVFEDLHWVDPSSLKLLDHILNGGMGETLFVLCTFRPEFTPPWQESETITYLALEPLDDAQAQQLVVAVDRENRLDAKLVDQIVERADGVPLFIEELTKSMTEAHQGSTADGVSAIPETLQDSLLARLDRVGDAKFTAQLGAAIGRTFSFDLIAVASDLDQDTVAYHLKRLEESGLIIEERGNFMFKHALMQAAAYSTLLKADRQALHRAIASVLEQQVENSAIPQPGLLAHHHTEGGDYAAAIGYRLDAARQSLKHQAVPEGIDHLRQGMALLKHLGDSPDRLQLEMQLLIAIVMPIASTQGYTSSELKSLLERARELCQLMGNPAQLFPVLHGLGKFYMAQAEHDKVESLGRQLMSIAESTADSGHLLEAHRSLAMAYTLSGRFEDSLLHGDAALSLYDPEQHRSHLLVYAVDPSVVANSFSSWSLWSVGRIDEAAERARAAVEFAEKLQHPYSQAFALSGAATLHQLRREPGVVADYAGKAMEISEKQGFPYWYGWSAVPLGWALVQLGQSEAGIAAIRKGIDGFRAAGVPGSRPLRLVSLAEALRQSGKLSEALATIEQAARLPELRKDMFQGEVYRLHGELIMANHPGEATGQAVEILKQSVDWARGQKANSFELRALTSLVRLEIESSGQTHALDDLRALHERFDQGLDTADLREAKRLLDR